MPIFLLSNDADDEFMNNMKRHRKKQPKVKNPIFQYRQKGKLWYFFEILIFLHFHEMQSIKLHFMKK